MRLALCASVRVRLCPQRADTQHVYSFLVSLKDQIKKKTYFHVFEASCLCRKIRFAFLWIVFLNIVQKIG